MHNGKRQLHAGKAVAGAGMGAAAGWFSKGTKQSATTGAILGGLAGLLAGDEGLDTI